MALPIEVLLGIYLGILTGIIPALVAWGLGFIFKYFTGVTVPGLAVVVLGLAIAGANGGLLALNDPSIVRSANAPMLVTAIIVVLMLTLYAHNHGDRMGTEFPKHVTLRGLRERTLSTDVVELVGGRGQVRVTVAGEVADMEGYPPLSEDLRETVRTGEWTFPADLPLSELENRLEERLRTDHGFADVVVSLDERGRATVSAAPPLSGLSKHIPTGKRAVSVSALVPTGIARGDVVAVRTGDGTVRGTVVSARSGENRMDEDAGNVAADGGEAALETPPKPPRAPTTTGGEGRITVAVDRDGVETLLCADRAAVVVQARGTRREFELVSLLRRAGKRFRRLAVRHGGALDGTTLGEADVRGAYGVAVLAVRGGAGWRLAPRGDTDIHGGDELFAVGTRENLDRFAEAVA